MSVRPKYSYKRITTGTNVISTKPVTLAAIIINKALAGTVTITDGSSTVGVITNGATAPLGTVSYGSDGISLQSLTIVCSGTEDITVVID